MVGYSEGGLFVSLSESVGRHDTTRYDRQGQRERAVSLATALAGRVT